MNCLVPLKREVRRDWGRWNILLITGDRADMLMECIQMVDDVFDQWSRCRLQGLTLCGEQYGQRSVVVIRIVKAVFCGRTVWLKVCRGRTASNQEQNGWFQYYIGEEVDRFLCYERHAKPFSFPGRTWSDKHEMVNMITTILPSYIA